MSYLDAREWMELADKIGELLENPVLRKQMGEYGRRRVEEQLAWKYSVPVLLDAYETLFSNRVVRSARELAVDETPSSKVEDRAVGFGVA